MIEFHNDGAQVFVPDGMDAQAAIARTTHVAVGAHQDDIPIMAYHGILECFGRDDRWLLGVTVTDGSGSSRTGRYADYTNEQMRDVRNVEERKAAVVGEYGAAVLLDYTSGAVKNGGDAVVEDLMRLLARARPAVVYTHNLADKHDTHVATSLRTIEALRKLPPDGRPEEFYGCEVWRDLDWITDRDKIIFDVSAHENLAGALMGVYDSQIAGGKRYDKATAGRRLAHATFSESHAVDTAEALVYAMDLRPLLDDSKLKPEAHVAGHVERMQDDVTDRLTRLSRRSSGSG